ncbi:bleomycin hydrolase [Drosophila grimshawi]|uniref:Bleomycin hydrolase n=1 Tax=Drosophila grimshawi TaxID=7222 RepID=B4J5K2_DROGR|nr:bleomycin hydrolase [Drosophila grimshawi]EDW00765.1 GH20841 [Drosophila grimshawi]
MSETLPNTNSFPLNRSQLSTWRCQFFALPNNQLAQNICTIFDPIVASLRDTQELVLHGEEHHELNKLNKCTIGGPNWICTGLDLLRLGMCKDCELSAPYLFYWHKLERCNYFLNTVADLLACCEPVDGRTFQYLMKHAVPDAGNWQMFVNLIQKYGVMPKECYRPSWSSTCTRHLNMMLKSKLHEYCSQMHAEFTFGQDSLKLFQMIAKMMEELYKVISICLGTPSTNFNWKLGDEGKQLECTPQSFYKRFIAPHYAIDGQICLGHDPRLSSKYQRNYRIAHSSNMTKGLQQSYNNQPMEVLIQIIVDSLIAGSAVWLACDLQTTFYDKAEILSLKSHNFEQVFGLSVNTALNKAERLFYKATRRNKVLLLTGITLDAMKQPLHFSTKHTVTKTATSTGGLQLSGTDMEEDGVKRRASGSGKANVLNIDWLKEYAFEIVIDSRFVPPGVMHALQTQSIVELPIWDPMGALLT